jgi:hypothetical protein
MHPQLFLTVHQKCIVTCVNVTIDKVWVGNRIYCVVQQLVIALHKSLSQSSVLSLLSLH